MKRDLKNQFFISINAKYIIAHHPALADISGCEAHIIKLISKIKYGVGTVSAIEKGPRDYQVTVQFDGVGRKVMYAAFAKLKKVD